MGSNLSAIVIVSMLFKWEHVMNASENLDIDLKKRQEILIAQLLDLNEDNMQNFMPLSIIDRPMTNRIFQNLGGNKTDEIKQLLKNDSAELLAKMEKMESNLQGRSKFEIFNEILLDAIPSIVEAVYKVYQAQLPAFDSSQAQVKNEEARKAWEEKVKEISINVNYQQGQNPYESFIRDYAAAYVVGMGQEYITGLTNTQEGRLRFASLRSLGKWEEMKNYAQGISNIGVTPNAMLLLLDYANPNTNKNDFTKKELVNNIFRELMFYNLITDPEIIKGFQEAEPVMFQEIVKEAKRRLELEEKKLMMPEVMEKLTPLKETRDYFEIPKQRLEEERKILKSEESRLQGDIKQINLKGKGELNTKSYKSDTEFLGYQAMLADKKIEYKDIPAKYKKLDKSEIAKLEKLEMLLKDNREQYAIIEEKYNGKDGVNTQYGRANAKILDIEMNCSIAKSVCRSLENATANLNTKPTVSFNMPKTNTNSSTSTSTQSINIVNEPKQDISSDQQVKRSSSSRSLSLSRSLKKKDSKTKLNVDEVRSKYSSISAEKDIEKKDVEKIEIKSSVDSVNNANDEKERKQSSRAESFAQNKPKRDSISDFTKSLHRSSGPKLDKDKRSKSTSNLNATGIFKPTQPTTKPNINVNSGIGSTVSQPKEGPSLPVLSKEQKKEKESRQKLGSQTQVINQSNEKNKPEKLKEQLSSEQIGSKESKKSKQKKSFHF